VHNLLYPFQKGVNTKVKWITQQILNYRECVPGFWSKSCSRTSRSLQGNWLFADFPQRQGLSEIKAALRNPLINAGVGVEEATLCLHHAHWGCMCVLTLTPMGNSSTFFSNGSFSPYRAPWHLLQFRNHFFTQTVGLLGRVISPSQGRYLHTGQAKHRIKAYTDIHALRGIRTHDLSARMSEDSSCLRPRGHCDRQFKHLASI
jgi:hypothetical protein